MSADEHDDEFLCDGLFSHLDNVLDVRQSKDYRYSLVQLVPTDGGEDPDVVTIERSDADRLLAALTKHRRAAKANVQDKQRWPS